jgi:hypothetical protein
MTVRELFSSIGAWLEQTVKQICYYLADVLELIFFQKNWLDASLLAAISALVFYGWVFAALYNLITETSEHRKKYKEDANYREDYDEKIKREAIEREEQFKRDYPPFAELPLPKKILYGFVYFLFGCVALLLISAFFFWLFGFVD